MILTEKEIKRLVDCNLCPDKNAAKRRVAELVFACEKKMLEELTANVGDCFHGSVTLRGSQHIVSKFGYKLDLFPYKVHKGEIFESKFWYGSYSS